MALSTEDSASLGQDQDTLALAKKLLVAWVCGLFWDIGPLLAWIAFLSWALSGLATFSDSGSIIVPQAIEISLGLLVGTLGPVLLSYFLLSNWKLALRNGLLAVLIGWVGALIGWMAGGVLTSWVGSISLPVQQHVVLQHIADELNLVLPPSLSTLVAVAVVALTSIQIFPRRSLGISAGLVVGLVFSMASWFLTQRIMIVPSPFTWASVIFCTELIAGRTKRKDFIAWILLMLVAFGPPFVVAFLLNP